MYRSSEVCSVEYILEYILIICHHYYGIMATPEQINSLKRDLLGLGAAEAGNP